MGCSPAASCRAALTEATKLAPNRRKTSDGICASEAHNRQNPSSDHATGNAWDLSDDPANGCDAHALLEGIRQRQDKRVKYIISKRRICGPGSRGGGWNWKSYSGSNPHVSHGHVSIWPSARNATGPWFGGVATQPMPVPPGVTPAWAGPMGKRPLPLGAKPRQAFLYSKALFEKKRDGNTYWIQWVIKTRTNYSGPMKPDGFYGQLTHEAVWGFQGAVGLKPDGVVGPKTWAKLNEFA